MKIEKIEFWDLDVPFTAHTDSHMQFWLPHWRIVQVCRITLDSGVEGWGETIPNYTWAPVAADISERIVGTEAGNLLWRDELGAGVQMALFDAVGKALNVPAYSLLGNKVKEWCPISWWAMDMPPRDWARQCRDAVAQGYMTAKVKARTWYDLHAAIRAVIKAVPKQFKLDMDFNATLANGANAVEFLKSLEQYEQVAMIESPIPQEDVAGNRHIRDRFDRPLAMHFGSPQLPTALREDVTDGFVVCTGATNILKQATVCDMANKPFWLQLVGTGITTTWAAHLGAVSRQAVWPAITCMNIWKSQLIRDKIELRGGYYRVPEAPGLGIEVDQRALKRYAVDYTWVDQPRHLYRYSRANGEVTYYPGEKQGLEQRYPAEGMPVCEAGCSWAPVADNGTKRFAQLFDAVEKEGSVRRQETRTGGRPRSGGRFR